MSKQSLPLFAGYGVELEYMIVDDETLNVRPLADELLKFVAGEIVSEVELGEIAWSNELMSHVIELKTNGPATSLERLPHLFNISVKRMNDILAQHGARLMPTAMHPWMNPDTEAELWPHEYNAVYAAFDRIFDCRGHGWANLQSVHLNLPFANDEEFGRLHAAIRLLLPIMPALAASSPVMDRRATGIMDTRMDVYRRNAKAVPSVSGDVIPEKVFTHADYDREIFQRMYTDIRRHDKEGVLQHEWLNSRGAIARFSRNAIEIRVLDVQECPLADVAICAAIAGVLKLMTDELWSSTKQQQTASTKTLSKILRQVIQDADQTEISVGAYLKHFGIKKTSCTAGQLWEQLIAAVDPAEPLAQPLNTILRHGPLARRISNRLAGEIESRMETVYRELSDCLAGGKLFV